MEGEPSAKCQRLEATPTTDYTLCLKCQSPGGELVQNPYSYEKFLDCVHQHAQYGTHGYHAISTQLSNITAYELKQFGASWHRKCFQDTIHKEKLDRARKKHEFSLAMFPFLQHKKAEDVHQVVPNLFLNLLQQEHSQDHWQFH